MKPQQRPLRLMGNQVKCTHCAGLVWRSEAPGWFYFLLLLLQRSLWGCAEEENKSPHGASPRFITSLWRSPQHVTSSAAAGWSEQSCWLVIKGRLWLGWNTKMTSAPSSSLFPLSVTYCICGLSMESDCSLCSFTLCFTLSLKWTHPSISVFALTFKFKFITTQLSLILSITFVAFAKPI